MKFPKLLCFVALFLFSQYATVVAQVITTPKLTSSLGNASTIAFCNSATVSFTASGDSGVALKFEFMIDRGGTTIHPLGTGSQTISSFSTNTLEDGDIVYARVWAGGVNALTNSITIKVDAFPGPINFTSNALNNTICDNERVEFTASSSVSSTLFQYFLNGISIQGPSRQSTFTHLITSSSTVTLLAQDGSCSRSLDLYIKENVLQPGSIIGGGQYCNGDVPSIITSVSSATHNGNELGVLTPHAFYQWQSSFDGTNWSDITGAQNQNYTPPSLTQNTYFRRAVKYDNSLGNQCEAVSNQLLYEVLPVLKPGFIQQANQYFCLGDTFPTLTVSNSTVGADIRYQWQRSPSSGGGFSNIVGATGISYTPSSLTTSTLFKRATFSSLGSGCTINTQAIEFTLMALNSGSLDISQSTNICYNSTPTTISNGSLGSDATTNVGTISYAWQQSIDNVNWADIAGANQSSYSPPALQRSTRFRRVAINRQGSYSCSNTTNAILLSVYDEVVAGILLGDQTICEGGTPTDLSLSGTTSASTINYQWEMSSDNVSFNTITNTLPTLSFPTTATWFPMTTTYYRAIVRNSDSPGCEGISNAIQIFVAQNAEVVQQSGPGPQQNVCPGSPITDATFSITGSATTLSASGLTGSGLSFTGPVGGVYTLSGTPTADTAITITADGISPCTDASYQYSILLTSVPSQPDFIRKNTDSKVNSIFQNGGLWYNNTFCQNTTGPTTTAFFPFEMSTVIGTINYEWKVQPSTAGTINGTTGVMTWNSAFSGTATISVRSLGCAGNSAWLDTPVQMIADSTPIVRASALTVPQALNLFLGDETTGEVPECQINSSTPNTQFFVTTANGVSDYQSLQWSMENIVVGGGVTGVSSPGTIDANTGVVDWNPNFYGSLNIKAEAVNCAGGVDASSITTVQITANDDSVPNIVTVTPTIIPSCPPQGNYITSFSSNREVDWSIDNNNAGVILSTATNTANLTWTNDFSGTVRISAAASDTCATGKAELIAIVPGVARIETLTGLSDVQLCEGDVLQGIPYTISGFPNTANVIGLPSGITGILSATYHIVDIVYSGVPAAGQVYRLEILGQLYEYTAQASDTADDIVVGLSNSVSALPISIFYATRNVSNTLRLQPKVAGVSLTGTAYFITGFVSGTIQTISSPQREYIISGTLNNVNPGQYDYTITTEGGASFCQQESITGRITVVGTSSLTLDLSSTDDQTVCDFEEINPISYTINNANSAEVIGLPAGLTFRASSTQVIISGTPQLNTVTTTVYTYTVSTTNNISGCSPEVSKVGTITIVPKHSIQLISALGTDNQSICNSGTLGSLTPIQYTFGGGAIQPPIISGTLPNGIVSNYDSANNVLTISGTPTTAVGTPTTFNYGVNTVGPNCSSITLSGTIVIKPNPVINLLSAPSTINQTTSLAICNNSPIQNIQYELFESPSFTITGLPNGVSARQSGNIVTIEGTPNITINNRQTFTYTLTTNQSSCQPEVNTTGQIEVIPVPQINTDFINLNDVTNVKCSGAFDGAIRIPTVGPDLDLRIQGGQSPAAQVEEFSLYNAPLLGDEYRITINGINYIHTVIASSFAGPVQTPAEVRDALVSIINSATGASESVVTASVNSTSSLRLTADVAGTAFSFAPNVKTSYTAGVSTPTIVNKQILANVSTSYIYSWTGPGGFSSSKLQIENLKAGDYTLRVTAGSCFSEATFTISEPQAITANNELCNGTFKTTLSGGRAPYSLRLLDSSGNLLRSDTTNSIFTYNDLTPGANYRLEVRDKSCSIPQQFSVNIPFELQYNAANVVLRHDYCQQTPNTGDGSIVLGTSFGNAFTGGSGNFKYEWSGPSGKIISKDIQNLVAGDYTVTVTDNELGCTRTETFTISSNDPLSIALSTGTVLNSRGEIVLPCSYTNSGVIDVNVTGGFGVYTYTWERNGVAIAGSTNRLENLSTGVYTLTVTDVPSGGIVLSNRCQLTQKFTLVSPQELSLKVDKENVQQAKCSGQLVNIPVEVSGGSPPYTIKLNDISISTSNGSYTFKDIDPKTLGEIATISLTDQNNCTTASVSLTIDVPSQYSFEGSVTNIDCSQDTLGAIQLTASPAIPNSTKLNVEWYGDALHYFDTWSNGKGLLNKVNNPGTYTVSITNDAGCLLYTSRFEIEETSGKQLQVEILQEISSTSCNENQGRIDLAISNGYPPYTIQWETLSSINTWTLLPELNNRAIVTGLSSGTYRAIVSDSSLQATNTVGCSPMIITRNVELTDQRFELTNFETKNAAELCNDVSNGLVQFGLINTLRNTNSSNTPSLTFSLDGVQIPETSDRLTFDKLKQIYQISKIVPGTHQLVITASTTCQIEEEFTLTSNAANSIAFSGKLTYEIDLCSNGINIVVAPNDITGGTPFSGASPYDLRWNYYPDSTTSGATQTFFGYTINQAKAGIYSLMITDANGCQNDESILIEVVASEIMPFSIQGTLTNPESAQSSPVKVLPIQCESNEGGTIGIEVVGGLRPFEINWYKQNANIGSEDPAFTPLPNYKNQTYLSELEAANYKVEIKSLNKNCDGQGSIYTTYEEIITVAKNPYLFIVSGPYFDTDICAGKPGRISVEVFNNNQGKLFFYYNGELVEEEDNPQVNEQTHTLLIETPKEKATLKIVNEQGCSLTEEMDTSLGEPSFTFTSPTLESSKLILARETITFENTSSMPYVRSEWDFGDFTTPLSVSNTATSTQVNYSYPVSGAYNVTLRIYNKAGCYLETTQQVAVGKGYSIMVPNVFSPNNDGINDIFRPLVTGLSTIRFSVYDNNGSLIYNESVSEPDPTKVTDISIKGWDGKNAPQSPYFIYSVEGLLYDGVTKVEKAGTFILLR